MITAKVNPIERTVTIQYPTFAKQKSDTIVIRSYDEAASILRVRNLKFIVSEIRNFAKMRNYAYTASGTLTIDRQKALRRLYFIVDTYSEGSLLRLAMHIANSRVSFAELMPIKASPAKSHFDNRIVPIIEYCTELYEQEIQKQNRVKG